MSAVIFWSETFAFIGHLGLIIMSICYIINFNANGISQHSVTRSNKWVKIKVIDKKKLKNQKPISVIVFK